MADHERPLNGRGRRAAPTVAAALAERGWQPRRVLSSDARRTVETWQRMADELPEPDHVELRADFYLADPAAVVRALIGQPATADPVLVLGHNPGWAQLVVQLCEESVEMKTAYAALCESDASDWQTAMAGGWRLVDVVRPR